VNCMAPQNLLMLTAKPQSFQKRGSTMSSRKCGRSTPLLCRVEEEEKKQRVVYQKQKRKSKFVKKCTLHITIVNAAITALLISIDRHLLLFMKIVIGALVLGRFLLLNLKKRFDSEEFYVTCKSKSIIYVMIYVNIILSSLLLTLADQSHQEYVSFFATTE